MDNNELRLRIAELHGWKWFLWQNAGGHQPVDYMLAEPSGVCNPGWRIIDNRPDDELREDFFDRNVGFGSNITDYPNDPAASAQLMEELRLAGYAVAVLAIPPGYPREGKYEAKVYTPDAEYVAIAYEHGETMPEVISKVWLAVMEPQEEQG